jgi:hypothetical protein
MCERNTTLSTFQAEAASPGGGSSYPAQINNLPPPIIYLYKTRKVSGKTTKVSVGQPIELTTKLSGPLPAGWGIANNSWNIQGDTVGGFSESDSGIVLAPTPTGNSPSIDFYWVYPGDPDSTGSTTQKSSTSPLQVTYTYCAGPSNSSNGKPTCEASVSGVATFKVQGAGNITLSIGGDNVALPRNLNTCPGIVPVLIYGAYSGGTGLCVSEQ